MISVDMTDKTTVTLESVSQWATGQVLKVVGLTLSGKFDVSFSHTDLTAPCLCRIGKTYNDISIIPIPNYLLTVAGTVTVIFGEYTIMFDVVAATKPTEYENCEDVDTDLYAISYALDLVENSGIDVTTMTNDEIDALF